MDLDDRALVALAGLLRVRHSIDDEIATLIGRPPTSGNVGEVVAAAIFDIELEPTGAKAGYDGHFRSGPLAGTTVNVKAYAERTTLLDISAHPCDWYLVLMGPPRATADRGRSLPFRIANVYLFGSPALLQQLRAAGVGIGIATSVRRAMWEAACVHPTRAEPVPLRLTPHQVEMLKLFVP